MPHYVHTPTGVPMEMPYYMGVGMGLIPTQSRAAGLGHNPNIGSGVAADVWEGGGNLNWLAAAVNLQISCASPNDTAAGTGMRTVLIQGIDGSGNAISETLTTNGGTVVTTNQFRRVNLFTGLTSGSLGVNAGDITLAQAGGTNVQDIMRAGYGFGRACRYSVPTGYTLFIRSAVFTVLATSGINFATFGFLFRRANGTFRIPLEFQISSTVPYRHTADEGLMVQQNEDFNIRVTNTGQANTNVTAAFEGVLVDNRALL